MISNKKNFPHKLLLTHRQVASLRKFFASHSSADIKLWKTQLTKMIQSGGFLSRLLGSLLKAGLPLIKNLVLELHLIEDQVFNFQVVDLVKIY